MAYRQVDLAKHQGGSRSKRILALVPKHRHSSEDSNADDSSDEEKSIFLRNCNLPITVQPSDEESPAPSICSSLLDLNISDSDNNNKNSSPVVDVSGLVENYSEPVSVENLECQPNILSPETPQGSTQQPTPRVAPKIVRNKRKKPAIVKPVQHKRKKIEPIEYNWKRDKKIDFRADILDLNLTTPATIQEPIDYFYKFFSEDIIKLILEQTNLYAVEKTGSSPNISENDIKDFLSINLWMGVVKMPAYTDFWAKESRYSKVADIMPLKKFQKIRKFLHFSNNNEDDGDRYFKIRPLLEQIRKNCLSIEQEGKYSIDEMMVPYKGTRAGFL